MDTCSRPSISRRSLLASTAALLIAGTTTGRARTITQELPWQPGMATPPVPVRPGPWMFFTADEAALVEAAVDRLIPSDDRGPGGKDAGCAVFIDRQLAGPYGDAAGLYMKPPFMHGAVTQGYQMPQRWPKEFDQAFPGMHRRPNFATICGSTSGDTQPDA